MSSCNLHYSISCDNEVCNKSFANYKKPDTQHDKIIYEGLGCFSFSLLNGEMNIIWISGNEKRITQWNFMYHNNLLFFYPWPRIRLHILLGTEQLTKSDGKLLGNYRQITAGLWGCVSGERGRGTFKPQELKSLQFQLSSNLNQF